MKLALNPIKEARDTVYTVFFWDMNGKEDEITFREGPKYIEELKKKGDLYEYLAHWLSVYDCSGEVFSLLDEDDNEILNK